MSDQVSRAFNWIDARIARTRKFLEDMIENNVRKIEQVSHHTSKAAQDAIKKAEEKHTAEVVLRWTLERHNIVTQAIEVFKLPRSSDRELVEYFDSKMMEDKA